MPPARQYLSDRPEERAIEDIFEEEHVPFTTPLKEGDPYHTSRPDYYYDVHGLGRRALEIKNRNPASFQSEYEADRDFVKESRYPVDYWGSYQLTEPAIEKIMEKGPLGTVLHEPLGFQYHKSADKWKSAFRQFILEKKHLGAAVSSGQIKANLLSTSSDIGERVSSPVRA